MTTTTAPTVDDAEPESGAVATGATVSAEVPAPARTRWWSRLVAHPERGASVSVMSAGLLVAGAVFLGLVVDGGAKVTAHNRADATAQEAARAGVQAATTSGGGGVSAGATSAAAGSGASVNAARAVAGAQAYLAAAGVTGAAVAQGGDTVRVTVTITEATKVVSMIGISSYTTTGTAQARVLYARS